MAARMLLSLMAAASAAGFAQVPYESDVSSDIPFHPNFVSVLDSAMHYIEAGDPTGPPIVLVHGNPTSSYLWRNVVPHLTERGRVIAVDHIGFGRSGKPGLFNGMNYTYADHSRYFAAFIDNLGLEGIYFIAQDWGGAISLDYAMKHKSNVKGYAFFDALIRPWDNLNFLDDVTADFFRALRQPEGEALVYEQNLLTEGAIRQGAGRPLGETEMNYYRAPFIDPLTRLPQLTFPNQIPIGGQPVESFERLSASYEAFQASTQIPKLFLVAKPGLLLPPSKAQEIIDEVPNLKVVDIGYGVHHFQESSPTTVGEEINSWLLEIM